MKTMIFDLDGTLCDTLADIQNSMNLALEANGFKTHERSEYVSFIGDGIVELTKRAIGAEVDDEIMMNVLTLYDTHYKTHCDYKTRPFPKMYSLLRALKKEGYQLAVISNKPDTESNKLIKKFFPDTFIYVTGAKDSVKRKPETEVLEIFCEKFNVKKEELIYVGDSRVDAMFSENFGIGYFLLEHGYEKKDLLHSFHPIAFIDNPMDILKYIK